MSGTGARSDIESEYKEAKETARALLMVVGILVPDGVSMRQYRAREAKVMRDVILKGEKAAVEAPNDPFACDAAILGLRYLHHGRDLRILEILREQAHRYPAYGDALTIVALRMKEMGADMPDWLRMWESGNESEKNKRWRRERANQYRIGMVVEAMVTGTAILLRYGKDEREQEQLQWDLQAVRAAAGTSLKDLPLEDVLDRLNKMRARRRGNPIEREKLTERNLVELTKQAVPDGINAILPEVEVRMHFPNLHPTSGETTKDRRRTYSICDAVAEVLQEGLPRRSRGERGRPWDRTVFRAWQAYRNRHDLRGM